MKVLIIGLNKSGTTALAYKLRDALGPDTVLNFEPGKVGGAEDTALHQNLVAGAGNMVTKNLLFPTQDTNWQAVFENAARYDRAIWIVRDPRDILISNFFYHWYGGHKAAPEKFQLALKRTRQKESEPQSIAFIELMDGTMAQSLAHLRIWQQSWYDILTRASGGIHERFFVFKYEDFVDQKFDEVSAYTGLEFSGDTEVPTEHQRVVRTRAYDNWRRWFTERDVAFFQPIMSEYLKTMGYNQDDWDLTPMAELPSAEGSDYMQKLYERSVSESGKSMAGKLWKRLTGRS